jgi:phosphoribosylamine--glycine ligase
MITEEGPKTIEFNCRLGDPETQVILPRLETDLAEIVLVVIEGRLDKQNIEWSKKACVGVVMVSGGYPGHYERDHPIENLEAVEGLSDVKVFHAGTTLRSDPGANREARVVSDGGRVLNVTALGSTLAEARERAYEAARAVRFPGGFYRRDIAERVGSGIR